MEQVEHSVMARVVAVPPDLNLVEQGGTFHGLNG